MADSSNELIEKLTFYGSVEGMAVEHKVRIGQYNMKVKHFHPEYEIFFILDGQRTFFFDNRIFVAQKGDLVIIDSNLIHTTRSAEAGDIGHNRIILYLTPAKVRAFDQLYPSLRLATFLHNNYGIYHLSEQQQNDFLDFYQTFKKEYLEHRPHYRTAIDLAALSLLLHFSRDLRREDAQPITEDTPAARHVYEIAEYLSEHYAEDISLDDLAARFFLSKYYLCRTFREVTQYSVREYINLNRIRASKHLLEESDLTMAQIAQQVGFHSLTHFEKIFKTYMTLSPLQYRRQKDVYVSGVMPVASHLEKGPESRA